LIKIYGEKNIVQTEIDVGEGEEGIVCNNFSFDQLGIRVPTIIVSLLIKRGVIDHTCYDHTSLLATIERLMGLSNLTERNHS